MSNKKNATDVFNFWMSEVKDDALIRFSHSHRDEATELLMGLMFDAGIDIEEARSYRRKVIEFMTTDEGRKGKGKYKGWVKAVEESFDCSLAKIYVKITPRVKEVAVVSQAPKFGTNLIKNGNDKYIKAWCKHHFGATYTDELCFMAHTIGSGLNIKFMQAMFEDKEILKGNYPDWLRFA